MKEFFGVVLFILIIIGIFLGVAAGTLYGISRPTCMHTLNKMGAGGCMGYSIRGG